MRDFMTNNINLNSEFHDIQRFVNEERLDLALEKAIKVYPYCKNNHIFENTLGVIYYKQKNFAASKKHYVNSIKIKNDYTLALSNLGNQLLDEENIYLALKFHIKTVSLEPKNLIFTQNLYKTVLKFEPSSYNEIWKTALSLLLSNTKYLDSIDVENLKFLSIKHLMLNQEFLKILDFRKTNLKSSELKKLIKDIFQLDLFKLCLKTGVILDIRIEKFVSFLRNQILINYNFFHHNPELLPELEIIAIHCFKTDYVFYENKKETKLIRCLEDEISDLDRSEQKIKPYLTIILSSYRNIFNYDWINKLDEDMFSNTFFKLFYSNQIEEKNNFNSIQSFHKITNETSKLVRNQYEESPYPKWEFAGSVNQKINLNEFLKTLNLSLQDNFLHNRSKNMLIAGCGTGREPICYDKILNDCHITAIDLSRSSLSYAIRMSKELNSSNIKFINGDLLNIDKLKQKFDIVVSSGVLHHMKIPEEGLKKLIEVTKPGGLLKISLYSKLAREHLLDYQKKAKNINCYDLNTIRNYRNDIIIDDNRNNQIFKTSDFYSLHEFRDLIFHKMEHQYDIPSLEKLFLKNKIRFIGFQDVNDLHFKFTEFFKTDKNLYSLHHWNIFEENHPKTFSTMYQMWLQKLD